MHVKTASDSKAPHNSTAFITLYGSKSQSRDLPLTSSHEAFLPGSVEEFKVSKFSLLLNLLKHQCSLYLCV